jgi:predicted phosphate transport protein (TIGR00153 family)
MYLQKVTSLFGRTRALENQVDEFLDKVSEAGLVFSRAVRVYLEEGACAEFDAYMTQESSIEEREDSLRRSIEIELYQRTLIPDLRGDVLRLLEDIDSLVNAFEGHLFRISIQQPEVPEEFHKGFIDLTETVVTCVDSVVLAARAFFRDIESVRDHASKTMFFESEADRTSTKLQRAIFAADLPLERKIHLRYFVERIDDVANKAEDVADSLQIYTIKRKV